MWLNGLNKAVYKAAVGEQFIDYLTVNCTLTRFLNASHLEAYNIVHKNLM